jgi:hypothetical protein
MDINVATRNRITEKTGVLGKRTNKEQNYYRLGERRIFLKNNGKNHTIIIKGTN